MGPFTSAPFLVIWETTRACALACAHCRAEAIPRRDPRELTADEGRLLIERVAAFGDPAPLLVLTGGDPLRRPDIVDLVAHAAGAGLGVSLTPSATAAVTESRLRALRDAGLARLAVSLDGATPEAHDAFRGVLGSHRHTMAIAARARALGLPLQVNTTVSRRTVEALPELARQVEALGAVLWALFFLIPVGRAERSQALDAEEIERVLEWAGGLLGRVPFGVKTTEAPHVHRVLARAHPAGGGSAPGAGGRAYGADPGRGPVRRAGRAVTDGNGVVFVDHVGNICPSGFLPMIAGNVRRDDLVAVYRESAVFTALRDFTRLGGRCGCCEYRDRCGGSRARAFAASGDPLAEDPGCAWRPGRVAAIAGGSDARLPVSEAEVQRALDTVLDPELGMSIVELGLVYGVRVQDGTVGITMTLTAPGCPLHEVMPEWVQAAVGRVPGVEHVDVTVTFDPPWSPDRIKR
jgi:radical SAM protein